MEDWKIYRGEGPHDGIDNLPEPPPWRQFRWDTTPVERHFAPDDLRFERYLGHLARGKTFQTNKEVINLVNAALYLRRPLLVSGKPGVGKSSLAYAVAYELQLGPVLHWTITSRSTLQEGLYHYDAIGRLHEASLRKGETPDIGQYLRLGCLGTAFLPSKRPRVLLIDEIDKSDVDLPNDLLTIFEEGEFLIPELARLPDESVPVLPWDGDDKVPIVRGRVRCTAFPFVVLTDNSEREFSPPFLRRCLRLEIKSPEDEEELASIVAAHLGIKVSDPEIGAMIDTLIKEFIDRGKDKVLATDQLLNAVYMTKCGFEKYGVDLLSLEESLHDAILKSLT